MTRRSRLVAYAAGAVSLAGAAFLFVAGDSEPIETVVAPGLEPAPEIALEAAPTIPAPSAVKTPIVEPIPTDGMKLHGILAGGALISHQDGSQRLVRLGREALPGVVLTEVAQHHAMLSGPGGTIRLTFANGSAPRVPTPAELVRQPSQQSTGNAQPDRSVLESRLGLEPRKVDGRTMGFAIRADARLPLLERAGLKPGDVLLSVNGQAFDSEEKVMELSSELAGSRTAEIEYERSGRRMKISLQINP